MGNDGVRRQGAAPATADDRRAPSGVALELIELVIGDSARAERVRAVYVEMGDCVAQLGRNDGAYGSRVRTGSVRQRALVPDAAHGQRWWARVGRESGRAAGRARGRRTPDSAVFDGWLVGWTGRFGNAYRVGLGVVYHSLVR